MNLINFIIPNMKTLLNSGGLSLDIIGAVLIFKFGLPEPIGRDGYTYFMVRTEDDQEEKQSKTYDFLAKAGIWFLILGFAFQLLSNYVPQGIPSQGKIEERKTVIQEGKPNMKSVEEVQLKVVPKKP
ncbi:MAG: hypothetical protein AB7D06_17300 [Pedobacter sp.]